MIEQIKNFFRRLLGKPGSGIRYTIGGVIYLQRPLVLLQIEQLSGFLATIALPPGTSVVGIVRLLGDRISDALAILLNPAGTEIDQKDLAAIAAELRKHVDIETAVKVVEDFLSCNPVGLVFDRLTGALAKYSPLLTTGSPSSSASSPAET